MVLSSCSTKSGCRNCLGLTLTARCCLRTRRKPGQRLSCHRREPRPCNQFKLTGIVIQKHYRANRVRNYTGDFVADRIQNGGEFRTGREHLQDLSLHSDKLLGTKTIADFMAVAASAVIFSRPAPFSPNSGGNSPLRTQTVSPLLSSLRMSAPPLCCSAIPLRSCLELITGIWQRLCAASQCEPCFPLNG
jgi:hypothetical protein